MLSLSRSALQRGAALRRSLALARAPIAATVAPVSAVAPAACRPAAAAGLVASSWPSARSFATQTTPPVTKVAPVSKAKQQEEWSNVTEGISSKIGRNLHLQRGHPLNIIKRRIEFYFEEQARQKREAAAKESASPTATAAPVFDFVVRDNVDPHVTVAQNFDSLLFTADHPGRSLSDTFYFDRNNLLRTHTTAHECEHLREGLTNFLTVGDCYRRDEIDASHYPVFHQFEGVRLFHHDLARYNRQADGEALVVAELKQTLEGLALFLFGPETQVRWVDAFFPFTHPSFEMEVLFRGEWLEVLGCGVLQHAILDANVASPEQKGKVQAWAFGMGLERLAMVLFDIPDIRLFWSSDARFLGQFAPHADELLKIGKNGKKPHQFTNIKFSPFSKYPGCYKDVSFWLPKADAVPEPQGSSAGGEVKPHEGQSAAALAHAPASASSSSSSAFHENDLCSLVREVAGDLVENVTLLDSFVHPKTGAESRCYRILFRALDRNLTNEEIDVLQEKIRQQIPDRLGLKLR